SRRRHTRSYGDWSSDVCSSDLAAVGDDRSAAGLARATAAALGQGSSSSATTAVLGVLAYPPSLPFYLGRPVAVATATGVELTSNYIADYQDRYRDVPGSPLLPEGYWREALARCPLPTVFVATADRKSTRLNSSHRTISYAVFCLKKKKDK